MQQTGITLSADLLSYTIKALSVCSFAGQNYLHEFVLVGTGWTLIILKKFNITVLKLFGKLYIIRI